jgi:hypothetical protein
MVFLGKCNSLTLTLLGRHQNSPRCSAHTSLRVQRGETCFVSASGRGRRARVHETCEVDASFLSPLLWSATSLTHTYTHAHLCRHQISRRCSVLTSLPMQRCELRCVSAGVRRCCARAHEHACFCPHPYHSHILATAHHN